jgi:cell division protein ZapA
MGQVAIAINGRRYEVSCDDGEEDRLRQLAEGVDQRVRTLAASVGQVGEVRLLLLACLLMQDELTEAGRGVASTAAGSVAEEAASARPPASPAAGLGIDAGMGEEIDRLAKRIEAVAAQLKQP